jgi:aminoglycoside phosphotransferase family enzyme/predicted kinase
MVTEDQSRVIELMSAPRTHGGAPVERIETHASVVFLAGERAWKLKRAVRYPYLDFSTAARRRVLCEAEVRLNRRTAPTLYRGVVPVTQDVDGALALGGAGAPVDWVVEMVRFDQAQLLDRLAACGQLDLAAMRLLAAAIARFHASAERRPAWGGRAGMAWVIDGNEAGLAREGRGVVDPALCLEVIQGARAALTRHGPCLDARQQAGLVRQCHGDLHLRNIVMLDGHPTPFDGVEFNDHISSIDVLYDLAFLVMDLWRHDLRRHAHVVLNAYLSATADVAGLELMPLFLSNRAAVRAMTSATAAGLQAGPSRRDELRGIAATYVAMAARLLAPPSPALVAVGGVSGTGKSTLAYGLGPSLGAVPGALVVRTDEVRKQLCGVSTLTRLSPESYAPEMSARVYAEAIGHASAAVSAGHAAIVDGVFARPSEREAVERAAASAGVPFVGVWLEAPEAVLIDRAERRQGDASDATADVVRVQLARGTGPVSWDRVDATAEPAHVLGSAADVLARRVSASLQAPAVSTA